MFKNLVVENFKLMEDNLQLNKYKEYIIDTFNDTNITIFGKRFTPAILTEPLKVKIHKKHNLVDCIPKINDYLHWLAKVDKNDLIKCYNENEDIINMGEKANDVWYNELYLNFVLIRINKNREISFEISARNGSNSDNTNNWEEHFLEIEINEEKILKIIIVDNLIKTMIKLKRNYSKEQIIRYTKYSYEI